MKVVTYATNEEQYLDALRDSCKKFNYDLTVLGLGQKWNGFGDKILAIHKYLEDIEGNDFYIITDAYDIIFTKNSENFLKDFHNNFSENDIVFNSEVLPNSYIKRKEWCDKFGYNHPQTKNKYKALNAGVLCGKRKRIIEFYNLLKKSANFKDPLTDDQEEIYYAFNKNKLPHLKIDYNCNLFTVVTEFNNDISFNNNKLYNKYTKTYPYLIHGAGKKTSLNKYTKFLDLDTSYNKSELVYNFHYYLFYFLDYLVLLGVIIAILILYKIKVKYYR